MRLSQPLPADATRRGFTLIELLVVIIIVGLLAGMITVGLAAAMRRAKRASITLEISQLSVALQKYKDQYGEYPPDFSAPLSNTTFRQRVLERHLRKAFPRFTFASPAVFSLVLTPKGGRLTDLDPAEALVFWLGGIPDAQGVPRGFCKVPGQPLLRPDQNSSRTLPLFQFEESRLADVDGDGWPEYYPPGFAPGQEPPYVYFAAWPIWYNHSSPALRYYNQAVYPASQPHPWGAARPYARGTSANARWVEPTGFQILCAGLDRHFGANAPKFFPGGENYSEEDWDNLTNFYEGTLEDASQDSNLN